MPQDYSKQVPTLGRIVRYRVSETDAEKIKKRRADAYAHLDEHRANSNGVMIHVGNAVGYGQRVSMIITAVHGSGPAALVNGKCFLDGSDDYWVTSVEMGTEPGQWEWPARG